MRVVLGQGLADALDEDGVVGWNTKAIGLQQMAFNLQIKVGGQCAQKVVGRRAQIGIR